MDPFTPWKIAMLLTLPLMASKPKLRTWGAMLAASLAAWLVPYGYTPAYLGIDLLAGFIVIMRPAGTAQRIIGAGFVGMSLFHIGFLIAGADGDLVLYMGAQTFLGWLQWVTLALWGLDDGWRYIADRFWPDRGLSSHSGDHG